MGAVEKDIKRKKYKKKTKKTKKKHDNNKKLQTFIFKIC